ncbi:MAG: hypothetical protein WBD40_12695 [Tepidisphaeraceae bacterium]
MSSLPQPLPPVPVQPIMYSAPVAQRPGLITAIGVISIIVGSLGLLFNGIAGLQAFGLMMVSNMTKTMAASQKAAAAVATAPPAVVDPLSMPQPDRQNVVRGLAMVRPITKPRREQLDALLTKSGRQIYRLTAPHLTAEVVRQSVTEHGQFPDAKGGEGPDFFVIGEGRIELADDHAKFVPGDGRETIRVSAADVGEQANWRAGLTPQQVKGIVDKVEQQAGTPLSAAQKSKLDLMLNSPTQGFFTPAATIPEVTSQIQSVSMFNTGNGGSQLMLSTPQGMLTLDDKGNTVNSTTWGAGAPGGVAFAAGPTFNVNMTAAIVAIATALASACLAIYLLVIGIMVLRQHPRGARLHKIYAWIKIPLAIAGGIAWVVLWTGIIVGSAPANAPRAVMPTIITGSIIAVVVGCIYPIALLLALRAKSVREYYATVQ